MKNKLFNKKWLVLLMAVMLIVLSITGCGGKDDDDDEDKDSKSKKELSIKDEDDEDEDEDDDKKDDKDAEATPEPTEEPEPEPTEEPVAEVNWMTAYEDYFDTCGPLLKENVIMFMDGEIDGVYLGFSYGYSDEYSAFSVEVYDDVAPYFELITDSEYAYYYSEVEDEYYMAVAEREDDTEADIMEMAALAEDLKDSLEYKSYGREDTNYDGVVYDSIECSVIYDDEECDAICYINRDTQVLEGVEILDDDRCVMMTVEFVDCGEEEFREILEETIAEYEGAEEITFEEMGYEVLEFMFTYLVGEVEDEPAEPTVSTGTNDDDWSTAYDDFFDDGMVIPDEFEITTSMDLEGFILDYVVACAGNDTMVRYRIGDYGVDAYTNGDWIIMENIGLNGSEFVRADIDSNEDVVDILGADFTELMGGATESVSSSTYVEAVTEDGVTYDVLEIDADDTPALVYIDRDKQIVSKMIIESEGLEMVCKFDDLTGFQIPSADDATEMTKVELATYYQEAIIGSVFASMGMEY